MSETPSDDAGFDVQPSDGTARSSFDPGTDPAPAGPTETRLLPTWPIQVPAELPVGTEIPEEQIHAGENATPSPDEGN